MLCNRCQEMLDYNAWDMAHDGPQPPDAAFNFLKEYNLFCGGNQCIGKDAPPDTGLITDFGPDGPQPGTVAYTAFLMAQICPPEEEGLPDDYWDAWKDEMYENMTD